MAKKKTNKSGQFDQSKSLEAAKELTFCLLKYSMEYPEEALVALISVLLSEIHNIKEHCPHGDIEAWVLSRMLKGDELDLEFGKYINLDN
jgi:hypothetical protein